MAHFRGTVRGTRSEKSALGQKSGLSTSANGWSAGVDVEAYHDPGEGVDVFEVYARPGDQAKQEEGS